MTSGFADGAPVTGSNPGEAGRQRPRPMIKAARRRSRTMKMSSPMPDTPRAVSEAPPEPSSEAASESGNAAAGMGPTAALVMLVAKSAELEAI